MASLYESSARARKLFTVLIILMLVVYIVDTYILTPTQQVVVDNKNRFYLDPQNGFGAIAEYNIDGLDYNANAVFSRESVHGFYPDTAYIHKIEQPRENLNTIDNAKRSVRVLGFPADDFQSLENGQVYKWTKDNLTKNITFDRRNLVWNMDTLFLQNIDSLASKQILQQIETYKARSLGLVSSLGFDTAGIRDGVYDIRFAELGLDGIFLETTSYNVADYIFINIFRKLPLADLKPDGQRPPATEQNPVPPPVSGKVYKNDPRLGQIELVVSNSLSNYPKDVFRIKFTDFEYSESSVYLIKSADEAWTDVQLGKGSLVLVRPQGANYFGGNQSVNIKEFRMDARLTELAYYEPEIWSGYTYPIFVFRGTATLENGGFASFVFFVDAIKRAQ